MRARFLTPLVAAATLIAPASASAYFTHTIMPGESLTSIAATDGLSIAQLAAANGMSTNQLLYTGRAIQIPPLGVSASALSSTTTTATSAGSASAGTASATPVSTTTSGSGGDYLVHPGDTLTAIAARAGTTVSAIAAANGLDVDGILPAGRRLRVFGLPPAGASSSSTRAASTGTSSGAGESSASESTASTATAETQPVGNAAQGTPTNPPFPTPERMTASQIAAIASSNGVPSSLADAIAWQESGFNNDLVSSADARGIMQILPGTWDWIQSHLTPSAPLAPASAADNVRGGVLLLHSLLNSTGGNPATTAAGYYQGLSSVQRDGLFSDTQRYVRSVLALQRRFGGG
jgi:N-acetylmuramoyl-L-alanine amidase